VNFSKKQDYYNIKALITQSFKESIGYYIVLRIALRKRVKEKRKERKKKTGKQKLGSKNLKFLTGAYLTNSETGTISMPALINSGTILFST